MNYNMMSTVDFLNTIKSKHDIKMGKITKLIYENELFTGRCQVYIFTEMLECAAIFLNPMGVKGEYIGGLPTVGSFCIVTNVEGITDRLVLGVITKNLDIFRKANLVEKEDLKEGEKLIRSSSGAYVRLGIDGEVTIVSKKKNKSQEIVATIKLLDDTDLIVFSTAKHKISLLSNGSVNIESTGSINIHSEENIVIKADNNIQLKAEKIYANKKAITKGVARKDDIVKFDVGTVIVNGVCPATGLPVISNNLTPIIGKIMTSSNSVFAGD